MRSSAITQPTDHMSARGGGGEWEGGRRKGRMGKEERRRREGQSE